MQFTARSDQFRDALSKILSISSKKGPRPILNSFLIKNKEFDSLEITGTDLEIFAKIKVEAQIQKIGEFCISAKNFTDVLREMPSDILSFQFINEKNILELKCKNISFSLLTTEKEDFPVKNFKNIHESFFMPSWQWQNIINKTIHAISADETRPFFNGIFLQQVSSRLRAVTTDGHRLALFDIMDFQTPSEFLVDGILIPRRGVNEIKKMVDSYPSAQVKVTLDESFIHLNIEDKYNLSIRLIVKEFPKYQTVIPSKTTYRAVIDRLQFLTSLRRMKVLATEKFNGAKLSLHQSNLIISTDHPSLGGASEEICILHDGPSLEIGFNVSFLIDTLMVFDGAEVMFEYNNELNPVIIRATYLPEFLSIIMPLKL